MQAAIIFLCVGVGIIHLSSIVLLIFSLKAEKRTDKKLWEIQAILPKIIHVFIEKAKKILFTIPQQNEKTPVKRSFNISIKTEKIEGHLLIYHISKFYQINMKFGVRSCDKKKKLNSKGITFYVVLFSYSKRS